MGTGADVTGAGRGLDNLRVSTGGGCGYGLMEVLDRKLSNAFRWNSVLPKRSYSGQRVLATMSSISPSSASIKVGWLVTMSPTFRSTNAEVVGTLQCSILVLVTCFLRFGCKTR